MSVMDMFRQTPAPSANPTPVSVPRGEVPPLAPGVLSAPVITPAPVVVTEAPKEGLDRFADLWEAPKVDPAAPSYDPNKLFSIDPVKLQESVRGMNFAATVTPELAARIEKGGPDAMLAMQELNNATAQNAFQQSTVVTAKMIESALTKAGGHFDGRVNSVLRAQQSSSQLRESNPALNHPAAAPLLQGLERQLLEKNPTASAEQISSMATEFLSNFAKIAAGGPSPTEVKAQKLAAKTDQDFSGYLN